MVEWVIMLLIYICLAMALCYLIIWVLGQLGISLPPQIVKIFWIIVILIVILLLWRMIGATLVHGGLPGV